MSRKVRSGSVLATLIGISAALCLAGCGSSKAGDNTASRSSSTSLEFLRSGPAELDHNLHDFHDLHDLPGGKQQLHRRRADGQHHL